MAKKSVAQNYTYNLIYQFLTVILPLVTTPYLSRILGATNIGIFGYTFSIITYFILFGSMGVAMYGQREIAYVQNDKKKQSQIFWEIIIIRFISYIIVLSLFYILFCIKNQYSIYYKILLIEMLANSIDITWYFQGMEDFKKPVIRNLIVKVMGLILIFALVKKESDLWLYFLIYTLSDFLGNATLWLYIKNYITLKIDKLNLKKHIKPIMVLFLPQIAIQIYAVLDKTMVGLITSDMKEVGYYDQAQKIVRALLLFVTSLGAVMNSRIANTYAKNNKAELKNYVKQSINMVWLVATPCIFGLLCISSVFVPWYFGKGYDPVINLINVTSVVLIAIGLNNVTGVQYLIQVKKQNIFTLSVVIGAISNVIGNFIFINMFGTVGAVYSSIIAEFIILFIQLYYTRDIIKIRDILITSINYIISSIVMFIAVKLLMNFLPQTIIFTIINVIGGVIVYVVMLLLLHDKLFINILNQTIQFIKNRLKGK